jgi:Tol biopolymer transport system component
MPALAVEPTPTPFAPGVISTGNEGAAAFSPDGATVYFMRSVGDGWTLLESHRTGGHWSTPRPAPFSGRWRDLDPAMAPDGSHLLFVSNRPVAGNTPIDMIHAGRRHAGNGMNLWRVDRHGAGWGRPVRLPDSINSCSMTFAPSIAADGSVYFIGCDEATQALRLMHAPYRHGHYLAPETVKLDGAGAAIRDPAIAPDGSFIVVSTRRAKDARYRLAIAFHTSDGWTGPQDLGDAVNQGTHSMGGQLGPDHRTLYFYSDRPTAPGGTSAGNDYLWEVSLAPWLDAHARTEPGMDTPWGMPNEASPAFAPDGRAVVFTRGRAATRRLFLSRREGDGWSVPQPAPFSGSAWMDMEPAMAPDGSFLVFISNRPAHAGARALDGAYEGQFLPGRGGNLWRVDRTADGWGTPERLPDTVNTGTSVYAPAVAADGSLYFMQPDPATGHFRLYLSRFAQGRYQVPRPLPFSDGQVADYDPAIAPDQSFIVFSSDRPPSTATGSAIFVAFATGDGWSKPVSLGPSGTESRLSPDRSTLYFSGADKRIHHFALGRWLKQHSARQ